MNRNLTHSEKDKIMQLNSNRLDMISDQPHEIQQALLDEFVTDVNICLTVDSRLMMDLALKGSLQIESFDKSISLFEN